jgi:hypothetical protein
MASSFISVNLLRLYTLKTVRNTERHAWRLAAAPKRTKPAKALQNPEPPMYNELTDKNKKILLTILVRRLASPFKNIIKLSL